MAVLKWGVLKEGGNKEMLESVNASPYTGCRGEEERFVR